MNLTARFSPTRSLHALEEVFGLLPELGVVPVERPGLVPGVM